MDPPQVIIRPVVREKTYVLAAVGKYTFRVPPNAHKTQIRQAVEDLFDVKVSRSAPWCVSASPSAAAGLRPHARVEEGDRPGPPGRHDPIFAGLAGLEES